MDTPAKTEASEPRTSPLVLIGSSAAGLNALATVLESLPADFPAPIVIALRLEHRHPQKLVELLAERSSLPIVVVTTEQHLEPGKVYVGAPGRNVEIIGDHHPGSARVTPTSVAAIDALMAATARIYADQLIGVVLTGAGINGGSGAQAIKAYGGTVIVQSNEILIGGTPTAISPASVDIVADLPAIGPLLVDVLTGEYAIASIGEGSELRLFLERVRDKVGIDFRAYKRPTIERRLRRRMAAVGVTSLSAYWRHVDRHPEELQQLSSAFLIKVTDFFRDPELFAHLREHVLPMLIAHARDHSGELRIWSAGCATGEEAYSIAIHVADLLGEEIDRLPVRIFATDVAADAVDFARHGVYPPSALTEVPADVVERHFNRIDGAYEISKSVRGLVVFGEHDLGNRAPFPRIDLVLCRNVLIYFTSELQRRALQRFAFSLRPGGLLALGKAESVNPLPTFFALEHPRLKIFRRNDASAPIVTDYSHDIGPSPALGAALARRLSVRRLSPSMVISPIGPTLAEQAITLLDRLSVGVVVVDRSYDIRAINVAARRLLDIRGAGLGDDLIHQVTPALGASLRNVIDSALRGDSTETVLQVPPDVAHELGRDLSIACSSVPVEVTGGAIILAQVEIADVSMFAQRQRELETERGQLESDRTRLQNRAGEAGVAVRELRNANDEMAAELGRLRAENEQLQLAHEEVQAAAEEIETLNEEQQAANEELETVNEELQATVEELNTANGELESRTVQLESLAAELEARRSESEQWYRAIVEAATDYAIFTTDSEGRIDSWPAGAQTVFGWESDEIIGQSMEILFTQEDRAAGAPEQEATLARESGIADDIRWHIRKDDRRVFIEGSVRARRAPNGLFEGLLKIGQDVTERRMAEQERLEEDERIRATLETQVESATAELRELSRRLLEVQEEERRHLARELHDEIGQVLTGLSLQLASTNATDGHLAEAQKTIGALTEQVRQLSMDLRPATLDSYGLGPALEWYLDSYRRRTGVIVELRYEGIDRRFPPSVEIAAFRLVQEALTNVARHSGAKDALVQLLAEDDTLTVVVRDRGLGFDGSTNRPSSGLLGMRERVALLDGKITIDGAPGDGVTITAELPVDDSRSVAVAGS